MRLLVFGVWWFVARVAAECPAECACAARGTIDCRSRALTRVPTDGVDPHATTWDLSHNNLTSLRHDAFHIGRRFTNALDIDLSFNQIANVSDNAFSHLENVATINLSVNNITDIAFKHMKSNGFYALYLSHNPHLRLPESGFELSHLKVLDMKSCGLSHIPRHFFAHMGRIEILELGRNKLTSLDSHVVSHLKYLVYLDLSRNKFVTLPSGLLAHLDASVLVKLVHNPFVCDCKTRHAYASYAAHRGHVALHCSYFNARSQNEPLSHSRFPQFYQEHCPQGSPSPPTSGEAVESVLADRGSPTGDHRGVLVAASLSAVLAVAVVVFVTLRMRRNVRRRDASPQRFSILKSADEN